MSGKIESKGYRILYKNNLALTKARERGMQLRAACFEDQMLKSMLLSS